MLMSYLNRFIELQFSKGRAARDVATLVSGTVIGQLAVVAASPILTRLYTPENFGVLAVYVALIGVIGVIAGLRYELAIPLPKLIGGAVNLLALSLIFVAVITLFLIGFIFIFYDQIPRWLNAPAIANYLFFIPVGVFLTGIYQAFNYWAIRRKSFISIARTKMQQGIGGAGAQVGLGLLHFGLIGLIIGQIIGQSAGIIALMRGAYHNDKLQIKRISWSRISLMAMQYSRFPKYTTWQSLLNVSSTMLPLILFASLLSPAIAGLYMIANRTLSMPLNLIGRSIGQVFHARAAEAYRTGCLDQLTLNAFQKLLKIVLGPMIFIAILAPDIFNFAFGAEWRQAGTYAQWMMPWLLIQFVVSPLSIVSSVTGHQLGEFISQILFVVIRIGALLVGALLTEKNISVELFALSGFVVYIGFFMWLTKILKISFSRILIELMPAGRWGGVFFISAIIAKIAITI
jgi:O-antigen/teichoic acid export membrane protein